MTAPNHLHYRGRGLNLIGPLVHHRLEQLPGVVGFEFEQTLINRRNRDTGEAHRSSTFLRPHGYFHPGLFTDVINRMRGDDRDLEPMLTPAHPDTRDPDSEGGFAKINHRG